MFKLINALIYALLFFSDGILANTQFSYMGTDILYNHVKFKNGYGKAIFTNNSVPQLNFFVGYIFNKFIGIECGYEQNLNKSNVVTIDPMSSDLGVKRFTALVSNVYYTKSTTYGVNLNFVAQLQINNYFSIIPVAGFVYMHTNNILDLQLFDDEPATVLEKSNYGVNFVKSKVIPRLGIRLQYAINKIIGVRASYIWEKTNLIQPISTRRIAPLQLLQAKLSNTSSVGIGMYIQF